MAVTADSVVVELLAKVDGYTAKMNGAASTTDAAMSKIEKSASRAEAEVQKSAERKAAAEERAAARIAEAAEKARIRVEEAAQKAALKAEELANRRAEREAAAAERAAVAAEKAAARQAAAQAKAEAAAARNSGPKGGASDAAAERSAARAAAAAEKAAVAQERAAARKAAAEEAAAARIAAANDKARLKEEQAAKRAADEVARQAAKKASAEDLAATRAAQAVAREMGRTGNATRNLGRQISDVGVGLAGGQNPFLIFAQQAPQVADALADTGGKAARVAAFFAGPWGAALLSAGSVLGILAGEALAAGDTIEGLVKKLQESAAKTRATAEAQEIFEGTAEGAAAAVDKMNEALGRANTTQERAIALDLARAKTLRQVAINALAAAEAAARASVTEARIAEANTGIGLAGNADEQIALERDRERAVAKRTASEKALQEAQAARANAEKLVVNASIPAIDGLAAAAADNATAATRRHSEALQGLRDAYTQASLAAKTNAERERAVRAYREGRTRIDVQLDREQDAIREANRKGRKGPSAETLARRAEAARIRDVRNNEAYYNELEQLNGQIIAAQRERALNVGEAAEFERQAIESDFRKRQQGIAADLSAGKYDDAQARTLDELNETARLLRLRNVAINEDVGRIREAAARDNLTLSIEQRQLRADTDIAESREQRRQNELRLIAIQYQRERIELDALRSAAAVRGDTDAVNDVTEQIDALPGLQRAEETGVEQRYRGRYDEYRRGLEDVDQLADSVDAVKVNALEAVTDELTNATTAALGLKGAFGDIVGQLIRIGIQRRLIGPLADQLFGAEGSTGAAGGFLSKLFGRASGGYVGPGQTVRVNEGRSSGIELLRMGSAGGTVIPLGQAAARPHAGSTVVVQPVYASFKGARTDEQTMREFMAYADAKSAQAAQIGAQAGARMAVSQTAPGFDKLGTL